MALGSLDDKAMQHMLGGLLNQIPEELAKFGNL